MSRDRRYYLILALGAALVLALAVACGSAEPEVVEKIVEVEKVVEVEVEKIVEVEKVVEVEVINREVVIATPSPAEAHFYMAATSPNAKRGGIARIHQHGPAGSYDIFTSTSNTRQNWMSLVYDQLLVKDARNPSSEVVPDVAYAWEVTDDLSTYTFHLREGVKFHNGSELTSEDVKASVIRAIDPTSYHEGGRSPIGGTLSSGGVATSRSQHARRLHLRSHNTHGRRETAAVVDDGMELAVPQDRRRCRARQA